MSTVSPPSSNPGGVTVPAPRQVPGDAVATTVTGAGGTREIAAATLARATGHLLGLQDPAGWWQGELETNVTMDAEDLLLRHFLGILSHRVPTTMGIDSHVTRGMDCPTL